MTGESAIAGLLLPGALPKTTHNNNTLCLKKNPGTAGIRRALSELMLQHDLVLHMAHLQPGNVFSSAFFFFFST